MNILIIGSGGREHALGWKLKKSPRCGRIFFAPGNAGTQSVGTNVRLDASKVTSKAVDEIGFFCRDNSVELVVIGPEDPLAEGLADRLVKWGLKVFGPGRDAAQIEADKGYCKELLRGASVPTAEARIFTDPAKALAYARVHETPLVVKAAGLAKGKGVIVTGTPEEAVEAVQRIARDREFGEAGDKIVMEERLIGQEVSILALVDGGNIYVLEPSQDHKQVGQGDTGPNTGGMGAYTPTPLIDDALMHQIESEILVPTVDALRRDDIEYKGVLYAGLMLTAGGPKVLEYNCRFGDPETQPLMVRMKADLLEAMLATIEGRLDEIEIGWDDRVACCVVVCSGGYPGDYRKSIPISGLDEAAEMEGVEIFHAGTTTKDGGVVTHGGRVINVVALGADLPAARDRANTAADLIRFEGAFFRRDIGDRVLKKVKRDAQ